MAIMKRLLIRQQFSKSSPPSLFNVLRTDLHFWSNPGQLPNFQVNVGFFQSYNPGYLTSQRLGASKVVVVCLPDLRGEGPPCLLLSDFLQKCSLLIISRIRRYQMYFFMLSSSTRAKGVPQFVFSCPEQFNKDRCQREKTGLCGKNSQTEGGGLTQTHFLMSTYQVIFGMPK